MGLLASSRIDKELFFYYYYNLHKCISCIASTSVDQKPLSDKILNGMLLKQNWIKLCCQFAACFGLTLPQIYSPSTHPPSSSFSAPSSTPSPLSSHTSPWTSLKACQTCPASSQLKTPLKSNIRHRIICSQVES